MKCLIVEDDLMSRQMLKEMLPVSFSTDIVVNGEEAVESFRLAHEDKQPYDIIFMDVEMPVLDGILALCQIRELERKMKMLPSSEVKVVMTTSRYDVNTVLDSLNKGGANGYLVKPLDYDKLKLELKNLSLI
jgi:two-component system chemotaxis response regulator CheY